MCVAVHLLQDVRRCRHLGQDDDYLFTPHRDSLQPGHPDYVRYMQVGMGSRGVCMRGCHNGCCFMVDNVWAQAVPLTFHPSGLQPAPLGP
jgi:hypothetical protein